MKGPAPRLTLLPALLLALAAATTARAEEPEAVRALVVPRTEAALASQLAARIERLPLREGERFRKGQLLVGLDCAVIRAERQRAEAELKAARHTFESNQKMRQLGSVSRLELAVSESKVAQAGAELAKARAREGYCRITAPFSGRVVKLEVHAHERVTTGQALLEILDDSQLLVQMYVPSSWLGWLQAGVECEVRIGETGQSYPAEVTMIGARVDPVSRSIPIEAKITGDAGNLLSGMSGSARCTPP